LAPGPSVESHALELDPGFHPFELFAYSKELIFTDFRLLVKIRSELSLEPTVLDAKSVFHYYP
jgi:hypothetical protein